MFKSSYERKKHDHVEHNVNSVVNLASQKLKELITKKQEQITQNSLLKGQKNVLNSDIHHYTKEAKEKEELIEKMIEEFNNIGEELIELEKEYAVTLQEYKMKEEEYKNVILLVNEDSARAGDNNLMENSQKKHEIRLEYENLMEIKKENKHILEEHFNLKRELYILELQYKDAVRLEEQRNSKARKGIDIINKMYYFEYKEEDDKSK
jgi:hypothetical protein